MPDSRAVLDEIRDRVHRMVTPDGMHSAPDRYLTDAERQAGNWDCIANIAGDLTRLAAAVRAVLDLADDADAAASQIVTHGYPAGRAPTTELRRRITDALGGTAVDHLQNRRPRTEPPLTPPPKPTSITAALPLGAP